MNYNVLTIWRETNKYKDKVNIWTILIVWGIKNS